MKRKDYQSPTMIVVKLQHRQMLMSSVQESEPDRNIEVDDYNWNDEVSE